LEFNIFFSSDEFDKDAFLKDVDPEDELESYSWVFGSKEQPGKQHAHIEVEFSSSPKEPHHARLIYIRSNQSVINKSGPYMENCARWLCRFFKIETTYTLVEGSFDFDKSYAPIIALPFPFVPMTDSSKILEGASITGVGFEFPKKSKLQSAIIQHFGDYTTLYISAIVRVRIKKFNASNELKKLSASVRELITKQEKPNEKA
jgi:hypothetical protein